MAKYYFAFCWLAIVLVSCRWGTDDGYTWQKLEVTATAYNSFASQTSSNPNITAWGDSLVPGKKYIAVSRDLIRMGLTHNTPVRLEGFEGVYWVKDKMHPRWKMRIDIYMDEDFKKAREWGRRRIKIQYGTKIPTPNP